MKSPAVVVLWIAAAACAIAAAINAFRDSRAGVGIGAAALVFAVIAALAGRRPKSSDH